MTLRFALAFEKTIDFGRLSGVCLVGFGFVLLLFLNFHPAEVFPF